MYLIELELLNLLPKLVVIHFVVENVKKVTHYTRRNFDLLGTNKKKNIFSKKLKVAETKCRDNAEIRLLRKEEFTKVAGFLSRQSIPATFSSHIFFSHEVFLE